MSEDDFLFIFQIKFIFSQKRTETLNFKRRKICLASSSGSSRDKGTKKTANTTKTSKNNNKNDFKIFNGNQEGNGNENDKDLANPNNRNPRFKNPSSSMIALGAATGAIGLLIILLTVSI